MSQKEEISKQLEISVIFSFTQHDGVKRELVDSHLSLIQAHGLLAPTIKLPQTSECACVCVLAKHTGGFKHLRTISHRFQNFKPKRGKKRNIFKTYLQSVYPAVIIPSLMTGGETCLPPPQKKKTTTKKQQQTNKQKQQKTNNPTTKQQPHTKYQNQNKTNPTKQPPQKREENNSKQTSKQTKQQQQSGRKDAGCGGHTFTSGKGHMVIWSGLTAF